MGRRLHDFRAHRIVHFPAHLARAWVLEFLFWFGTRQRRAPANKTIHRESRARLRPLRREVNEKCGRKCIVGIDDKELLKDFMRPMVPANRPQASYRRRRTQECLRSVHGLRMRPRLGTANSANQCRVGGYRCSAVASDDVTPQEPYIRGAWIGLASVREVLLRCGEISACERHLTQQHQRPGLFRIQAERSVQ